MPRILSGRSHVQTDSSHAAQGGKAREGKIWRHYNDLTGSSDGKKMEQHPPPPFHPRTWPPAPGTVLSRAHVRNIRDISSSVRSDKSHFRKGTEKDVTRPADFLFQEKLPSPLLLSSGACCSRDERLFCLKMGGSPTIWMRESLQELILVLCICTSAYLLKGPL